MSGDLRPIWTMREQWEAEGQRLNDSLQAYIDKLDRQIAWHAKWDKWLLRAVWPGLAILYAVAAFAVAYWAWLT